MLVPEDGRALVETNEKLQLGTTISVSLELSQLRQASFLYGVGVYARADVAMSAKPAELDFAARGEEMDA